MMYLDVATQQHQTQLTTSSDRHQHIIIIVIINITALIINMEENVTKSECKQNIMNNIVINIIINIINNITNKHHHQHHTPRDCKVISVPCWTGFEENDAREPDDDDDASLSAPAVLVADLVRRSSLL